MRTRWALAALLLAAPAAARDTTAQDKLLADALKDMHNKAAELYNGGDANGCYRVFQGGLYAVRPLLAHRPDLQELIDQGLQAAERQASIPARSKQLHETIEQVRTRLKGPPAKTDPPATSLPMPSPATPMPPAIPPTPSLPAPPTGTSPPAVSAGDTLWKRLGGEDGVTKIVNDWLIWAVADDKVNFSRGGKYKVDAKSDELKSKFVAYISSIADGTVIPTSSRTMAEVHKDMKITAAEFDALVNHLKAALQKNSVAAKDVDEVLRKVNATKKDIVGG